MPQTRNDSQLVELDGGNILAAPEYAAPLAQAGLGHFDGVMQPTTGRKLRAVASRENWRIEIDTPHAGPRGAYLKKHRERSWRSWLESRGWLKSASPGAVEAINIERLARDGIAAMQLVAYGERVDSRGGRESFVITEELTGFAQLDHYLREHFGPTPDRTAAEERDLRRLLASVADVAARFHNAGYNHRDLYCCHFFVRRTDDGRFDVRLIDLQRVEQRRWLRRRWIVKDLAQLAYSTPRERISCTRQLALIKQYLGIKRLRPSDKRLIRAVLAKRDRMIRHLGPHP